MTENETSKTSLKTPGQKAVETKGKIELERAGKMAAWTKKHGKNDAENPHSKQNSYPKSPSSSDRSGRWPGERS
jgi:hypothetical protein